MTDTDPRLEAVAKAIEDSYYRNVFGIARSDNIAKVLIAAYDALRAFDQAQPKFTPHRGCLDSEHCSWIGKCGLGCQPHPEPLKHFGGFAKTNAELFREEVMSHSDTEQPTAGLDQEYDLPRAILCGLVDFFILAFGIGGLATIVLVGVSLMGSL